MAQSGGANSYAITPMMAANANVAAQNEFAPSNIDPGLLGNVMLSMAVDNLAFDPQDTGKEDKIAEAVGNANLAVESYAVTPIPIAAIEAARADWLASQEDEAEDEDDDTSTGGRRKKKFDPNDYGLAA